MPVAEAAFACSTISVVISSALCKCFSYNTLCIRQLTDGGVSVASETARWNAWPSDHQAELVNKVATNNIREDEMQLFELALQKDLSFVQRVFARQIWCENKPKQSVDYGSKENIMPRNRKMIEDGKKTSHSGRHWLASKRSSFDTRRQTSASNTYTAAPESRRGRASNPNTSRSVRCGTFHLH